MKNFKKIFLGFVVLSSMLFIPNVKATEMSNTFKKALTNGKLVVNSVPPKDIDDAYYILGEYPFYDLDQTYRFDENEGYFMIDASTCNTTFTVCDMTLWNGSSNETHEVEIVYNYDADIYAKLSNSLSAFSKDRDVVFTIADMELLNYWSNVTREDDDHLDGYSLELKKALNYINTDFYVSNRAGDDTDFYNLRRGIAIFSYNGVIYYINSFMGTEASNVIYISEDTLSTKEAIIEAVSNRIKNYLGSDYEVSYGGLVSEWKDAFERDIYNNMSQWNASLSALGFDGWKASDDYRNDPTIERISFLDDAEGGFYFKVTINGIERKFIVKKDNSKLNSIGVKTSDITTNVSVSSESSKLPLDTTITASKLTSGEEYENLMKVINNDNSVTYEITLFSNTLDKNITKLADGTFEVVIPLPDSFEGKELIVYYVGEDNKVEEHKVDVINDGGIKYAKFTTNHFSIYTLAVNNNTNDSITNPNTLDNINVSFGIGLFAIISLVGAALYFKKQTN